MNGTGTGSMWKRRPTKASGALVDWIAGRADSLRLLDRSGDLPGDYHSYLFARPCEPAALPLWSVARAMLVAVCSGSVLVAAGFLILVWRPSIRLAWFPAALLVLAVAALIHPSVTFLVIESAMIGVLLTALLAVIQWIVDRLRRPDPPLRLQRTGFSCERCRYARLSTMSRVVTVSTDDSTADSGAGRSRRTRRWSTSTSTSPAPADVREPVNERPLRPWRSGKMSFALDGPCSDGWS